MPTDINEAKEEIGYKENGASPLTLRKSGSYFLGKSVGIIQDSTESIRTTSYTSGRNKDFQSILSEAYLSRDMGPINIFIEAFSNQCLALPRNKLSSQYKFFLENLEQLAKKDLLLAEWAFLYLISQKVLTVTPQYFAAYSFIPLALLKTISKWNEEFLTDDEHSNDDSQQPISLFGNLIASFLHKLRLQEKNKKESAQKSISNISPTPDANELEKEKENENKKVLFLSKNFKFSEKRTSGNRDYIIDCMAISSIKQGLLIFKPIQVQKNYSYNSSKISDLIESFIKINRATVPIKALFPLDAGIDNDIAIIEIVISEGTKSITIHGPSQLLDNQIINQLGKISSNYKFEKKPQPWKCQKSGVLEAYYFIKDQIKYCFTDLLINHTTPDLNNEENIARTIFNKIESNLNLKDKCRSYLLPLFISEIPLEIDRFDGWLKFLISEEGIERLNKDFVAIAKQISERINTPSHKSAESETALFALNTKPYPNSMDNKKIARASTSRFSKETSIAQFFHTMTRPKEPENVLLIKYKSYA